MKKFTKWLSLLLAGLMVSATLFACDDGSGWTDDEDDEDEKSESYDRYKKLSPEEVGEALPEAKAFDLATGVTITADGTANEVFYHVEKDGDRIKLSYGTVDNGESRTDSISYCDLGSNRVYEQGDDGEWESYIQSNPIEVEGILEDATQTNLFFDDDNYSEYDSDMQSYPLTEEAVEQYCLKEGMTASGFMKRKGTTYTFVLTVESESETQTIETVIKFQAVTVELPEAKLPQGGNPGTPSVDTNQPANTDKVPAVTDKVPDSPSTGEATPDLPEVMKPKSPEEVINDLKYQDSALFILYNLCPGVVENSLLVEKDGDNLRITIDTKESYMMSYMDTVNGYLYTTLEDGTWVKMKSDSVFTWDVLLDQLTDPSMDFLFDDNSYKAYDEYSQSYTVTDAMLGKASAEHNTEFLRAYMEYRGNETYCYYVDEFSSELDSEIYTEIEVNFNDVRITLPNAIEIENDETPDFDNTPYCDLNPGELYDAMLNTEELYLFIEVNGDQVKLEKSGDIISVDYYYAATQTFASFYIDLAGQMSYQWLGGAQYEQEEFTATWREFLASLSIDGTNYFLHDQYYLEFDDSMQLLEINPNLLDYSIRSAMLQRSDYYYQFQETISSSRYSKVTINFADMDVELPF